MDTTQQMARHFQLASRDDLVSLIESVMVTLSLKGWLRRRVRLEVERVLQRSKACSCGWAPLEVFHVNVHGFLFLCAGQPAHGGQGRDSRAIVTWH